MTIFLEKKKKNPQSRTLKMIAQQLKCIRIAHTLQKRNCCPPSGIIISSFHWPAPPESSSAGERCPCPLSHRLSQSSLHDMPGWDEGVETQPFYHDVGLLWQVILASKLPTGLSEVQWICNGDYFFLHTILLSLFPSELLIAKQYFALQTPFQYLHPEHPLREDY